MSATDGKLQEKLLDYIQDAHAMETNVLQMLDSMIANTEDDATLEMLTHHREETERHQARLAARLDELGSDASARKQAQSVIGGAMKSMVDSMRGDKPGKNARDGFMTEHVEIAAYELLERLALRAGDAETAEIARSNRADEEAMAQKIAASWDHVLDLTLAEAGVTAGR
jgi:ferritin-like metal-binding protein YciE